MYRRPKFLELLLEIRREMALEADYDVDLFVEIARNGNRPHKALFESPVVVGDGAPDLNAPSDISGRGNEIRKA